MWTGQMDSLHAQHPPDCRAAQATTEQTMIKRPSGGGTAQTTGTLMLSLSRSVTNKLNIVYTLVWLLGVHLNQVKQNNLISTLAFIVNRSFIKINF